MSIGRRDVLRVGFAAAVLSSCDDNRPKRARHSGHAPWAPASLAPESADPSKSRPIALVVRPVDADLRNGLAVAQAEFSLYESGGPAKALEEAMKSAVREGARLLVVDPIGEEATVARVARDKSVPVLLVKATNGQLAGAGEWVFFTCASDDKLGVAAVEVAKRRGASRIAILAADSIAGRAASAGFRAGLAAAKLPMPVLELRVGDDEAPFSKAVKSLSALHADAVFAPLSAGMLQPLAAEIARQGAHPEIFIGVDTMAAESLAPALEGASFVSHYHRDVPSAGNVRFIEAFRAKHHGPASDGLAAMGYDAGTIAHAALARAKDESREAMRDALASTANVPLTIGEATYDQRGSPDRTVVICRFAGGKIAMQGTVLAKNV